MIPELILLLAQATANPAAASAAQCGRCHAQEAAAVSDSPMSRALQKPADSQFLASHPDLSATLGKYHYSIRHEGAQFLYSVTDGSRTLSAPISWAFGNGIIGQTFLLQRDGGWYEGAVSYYPAAESLDLTPGHADLPRDTLEEAFGRKVGAPEAKRCFGCHSTDATWGPAARGATQPTLSSVVPGVQCWQCHKSAQAHARSFAAGKGAPIRMASLKTVSSEDLAAVCNQCHPSWADIASKPLAGTNSVRMQFYRLTDSRCYDSVDRRISCTACHDPHGKLTTLDTQAGQAHYDAQCLACHSTGARAVAGSGAIPKQCPVAAKDCVSCHMPKVEIPGLHHQFTDHQIRIVRAGESYPK